MYHFMNRAGESYFFKKGKKLHVGSSEGGGCSRSQFLIWRLAIEGAISFISEEEINCCVVKGRLEDYIRRILL